MLRPPTIEALLSAFVAVGITIRTARKPSRAVRFDCFEEFTGHNVAAGGAFRQWTGRDHQLGGSNRRGVSPLANAVRRCVEQDEDVRHSVRRSPAKGGLPPRLTGIWALLTHPWVVPCLDRACLR
jgi:hypothetical protein